MTSPIEIAKRVLKIEADAIFNLIDRLDEDYVRAIELILKHRGRLLVLGVGKSGHIGRKIAATLASTGQPSFYIHPTEAIHGDLGMMVSGDVCLMISHSGNTDELLATIPSIKRIGLPIIALTANTESKLARYADITLNTYVNEEACPYNLAPTSSTTAALAYGDAIAITLLTMKGFQGRTFCHVPPRRGARPAIVDESRRHHDQGRLADGESAGDIQKRADCYDARQTGDRHRCRRR